MMRCNFGIQPPPLPSPGVPGAGVRGARRSGFLLVELIIGLVIVALVMMGAAAIMTAVSAGWDDQDLTRSTQMQANQTYLRIQRILQNANYICYYAPGALSGLPATAGSIFFWKDYDLQTGTITDPYLGEMGLIEYDPTTETIWLYENSTPSLSDPTQMQQLTSQSDFAAFVAAFPGETWVAKQSLGGPGSEPGTGANVNDCLEVSGFQVYVDSSWNAGTSTQLPVVEYAIGFSRSDGTNVTLYNTTTVRTAATQPE
jgi:type II secretory pathway pseudopilin PulG